MSYRNKTYVVFDGDEDIWAYGRMKGWNALANMNFDFHDAHDLNTITDRANEETTKRKLRERFVSAKQIIVIVGEKTKNLYKFVRWELELALSLDLPIIAANLNGSRRMDPDRCPPILKSENVVHVSFNMAILKYAMDNFPNYRKSIQASQSTDWYYEDSIYKGLGL